MTYFKTKQFVMTWIKFVMARGLQINELQWHISKMENLEWRGSINPYMGFIV